MLVMYADALYDLLHRGKGIISQQGGKEFECGVKGIYDMPIMFEKSEVIALLQGKKDLRILVDGYEHAVTLINIGDD